MQMDIHTLALFLSLILVLQTTALFIQYRINKTGSGLGWWSSGTALWAAGFLFNFLRDHPSLGSAAIIANNILLIGGLILIYIGALRFFERRENRPWLGALWAVFTIIAVYFTLFDNNLSARRLNISITAALLFYLTAWSLLVYRPRALTKTAHFLGLAFLINGIFFTIRALSPFFGGPVGDIFTASLTQVATYVDALLISTAWTFGGLTLVSHRLSNENRESNETLQRIFNTNPDAILITRVSDGAFADMNDGFCELTGYTRAELSKKNVLEVHIWKNPAERLALVAALQEKGSVQNLEIVFLRKDGSEIVGSLSAKLIQINGSPHIISVTRDISEQKRMEAALLESSQNFKDMADLMPQIIFELDVRGNLRYVNHQAYTLFRYSETDPILGSSILTFNVPSEHPRATENIQRKLKGEVIEQDEYTMLRKDGSTFPALIYSSPILKNGQTIGLRGLIIDISERKVTEATLRENEEKYRILFHDSPDAYLIILDGCFIDCNKAAETMLRGSRAQIIGKQPHELSPEFQPNGQKSSEAAQEKLRYALENGSSTFEWLHTRLNESSFFVEVTIAVILLAGKTCLFTMWRDITERKRAENALKESQQRFRLLAEKNTDVIWSLGQEIAERERTQAALRESEHRYRLLAENTTDIIWVLDPVQMHPLFISPSAEHLLGIPLSELLSVPFTASLAPESREPFLQHSSYWLERFGAQPEPGMGYRLELAYLRKDGSSVWTETAHHFYWNEVTRQVEIQGSSRDITERKRLEDELQLQATTDELTAVFNRRHFISVAHREQRRAGRHSHPLSIVLIDLDHFKQINDTYGHAAGDLALISFTRICRAIIREIDVFARFGGDEFALLLPETDLVQAHRAMERIHAAVTAHPFDLAGKLVSVTFTAGISCSSEGTETLDELLKRADDTLYRAKGAGRNQIEVESTHFLPQSPLEGSKPDSPE